MATLEEIGCRFATFCDPQAELVQLQEDVQAMQLEGRRKMEELEANIHDSGNIQRLEVKTDLSRLEGKLRTEISSMRIGKRGDCVQKCSS